MKNLLYKEFRLATHPSVYIFFALAALLLVPSYPYYVSFFYLTLGIFLTFKTNRAENDIFYSALLPVRKATWCAPASLPLRCWSLPTSSLPSRLR